MHSLVYLILQLEQEPCIMFFLHNSMNFIKFDLDQPLLFLFFAFFAPVMCLTLLEVMLIRSARVRPAVDVMDEFFLAFWSIHVFFVECKCKPTKQERRLLTQVQYYLHSYLFLNLWCYYQRSQLFLLLPMWSFFLIFCFVKRWCLGSLDCFKQIYQKHGIRGIYKGTPITMAREFQGYGTF